MNFRLRHLLSNQTLKNLTRLTTTTIIPPHSNHTKKVLHSPPFLLTQSKPFHSLPHLNHSSSTALATTTTSDDEDEDVTAMNEFLSRFVHVMRFTLTESYPDCDKPTIDAMLVVIVDKLVAEMEKGGDLKSSLLSDTTEFSDDLWTTVWEVSNKVYKEMEREKKKERFRKFLQSDDVKYMVRFSSEVGVRGDLLREFRFKWAVEAMAKADFYEKLEEATEKEKEHRGLSNVAVETANDDVFVGEGGRELPKRRGRINYKLYGLDLSGEMWKNVADKIHEAEEVITPQQGKEITGECKLVMEMILGLEKHEFFGSVVLQLLDEWKGLLEPSRVDWINLLEKVKERDCSLYLKVMELVLDEPSFQANVRDYSKLIDVYAKESRFEDIERTLKKMSENGMAPDMIILTTLLHMYCKANNLEQAKATFESLKSAGFKPDMEVYSSMIMVYANAGKPKSGEALLREMELRDMIPTENIYMALLRAYANISKYGDSTGKTGAQRIITTMQFAGLQRTAESCALLIEACSKSNNLEEARNYFSEMLNLGFKPDDRCISNMISAYEKQNELGKALHLLLKLEKDGFEPGVFTYSVLVDWLGKLQLVDEAEQMLTKISQLGEAPPFKIQVSQCDMYARAGMEKKAFQALAAVEANKDLLDPQDFERIIQALEVGGFMQDAQRMEKMMEARGFTLSMQLKVNKMATRNFGGKSSGRTPGMR